MIVHRRPRQAQQMLTENRQRRVGATEQRFQQNVERLRTDGDEVQRCGHPAGRVRKVFDRLFTQRRRTGFGQSHMGQFG